jgi:hypothetical protein
VYNITLTPGGGEKHIPFTDKKFMKEARGMSAHKLGSPF